MKKTTIKKLVLAKETVRDLETPGLRRAAGGYTVLPCGPENYSYYCTSVQVACRE
jgi:hypothetical protein